MRRIIFCSFGLLLLPALTLCKEGYLGVYSRDLKKAEKEAMGIDYGVLIKDIVEDSPAEEAGLKSGDVILAIDNDTIEDKGEFTELIEENPGKVVELAVLREGKELKLQAELGEKEKKKWTFEVSPLRHSLPATMVILIPILAIVMPLLIPIMWFYFDYRKRAMKSKERIAAIEKGIELPPEPEVHRKVVTPLDILRRGFICLGIGVALIIFSVVSKEIERWSMGGGLILLFIGIALVLWFRIAIKKENKRTLS